MACISVQATESLVPLASRQRRGKKNGQVFSMWRCLEFSLRPGEQTVIPIYTELVIRDLLFNLNKLMSS